MKIIKTDEEYRAALSEIERLIDLSPEAGSAEADRLELLGLLVENYEKTLFEIGRPDPVDAIEFRMEQQNLAPRDLLPYLGSRSKVSEILGRKRPLTLAMVRALHEGLGIPAHVLIQDAQADVAQEEEESDTWTKYPLKEMIERGWVTDSLESIRAFFGGLGVTTRSPVLYRKTENIRSARAMDSYALTAWTTRIVNVAAEMQSLGSYRPGSISPEFMRALATQSRNDHGPAAARDFLRAAGIPLIVEPHLPYTYLDGAAILIVEGRPIIGLSVRHDRLDNFWFTLMHELAHVVLHSNLGNVEFIDDLDVETTNDPREAAADSLAGEALIPIDEWKKSPASRLRSPQAAEHLAARLNIHTSIVAGRMRHHWKAFRMFNNLVGHHAVRREFTGIKWP